MHDRFEDRSRACDFRWRPRVAHPQPLVKTQELPAIDPSLPDGQPDGANPEAVPREIADGDVTVPVRSSIESTLTFEVLRRQSSKTDDDDGTP
ncbi:MAG: hypothetical protein JXQ75_01010 [Phycisphaerae bacterium]|nr:hypothetical protein [Phycisphaerae bacterium]